LQKAQLNSEAKDIRGLKGQKTQRLFQYPCGDLFQQGIKPKKPPDKIKRFLFCVYLPL
jgi:hypothetical protein